MGDGAADGTSEGETRVERESLELLGLGESNLSSSHCDEGSWSSEQTLSGERKRSLVRPRNSTWRGLRFCLGRAVMKSGGFLFEVFFPAPFFPGTALV